MNFNQLKITVVNTANYLDKPLTMIKVKSIGNYHILIEFYDGVEKFVDF